MRKYEKPVMQVERFRANVSVARCDAETISKLNVASTDVKCLNSGSTYDKVFGQGNSTCSYNVCHYVHLEDGTYTAAELRSKGLTNFQPNQTQTYKLAAGYYGCFNNGSNYTSKSTTHMGSLAFLTEQQINSSY